MFRMVSALALLVAALVLPYGTAGPSDDPGVDYPLMEVFGYGDPKGECTVSKPSGSDPAQCSWQVYKTGATSYWSHYDFHNAAIVDGAVKWEWIDALGYVVVVEKCSFEAATDASDWYAGDCWSSVPSGYHGGWQTFRLTVTKFPSHCVPDPCEAHASVFLR